MLLVFIIFFSVFFYYLWKCWIFYVLLRLRIFWHKPANVTTRNQARRNIIVFPLMYSRFMYVRTYKNFFVVAVNHLVLSPQCSCGNTFFHLEPRHRKKLKICTNFKTALSFSHLPDLLINTSNNPDVYAYRIVSVAGSFWLSNVLKRNKKI